MPACGMQAGRNEICYPPPDVDPKIQNRVQIEWRSGSAALQINLTAITVALIPLIATIPM